MVPSRGAEAASVGDVGQPRKVAESADDLDVLTMQAVIQCRLELVPCGFIFVAVEADRGPANALNDREDRLAFARPPASSGRCVQITGASAIMGHG
jgi:hypothetical protein